MSVIDVVAPVTNVAVPALQVPAAQSCAVPHTVPHAPQFVLLVVVFVSHPSSAVGDVGMEQLPQPDAHVELQTPAEQVLVATFVDAHARPHAPQSVALVVVFVSHPSSAVGDVGLMQLPQSDAHVEQQTPAEQALVATFVDAQARPQVPQLLGSPAVFTSHPLASTPSQSAYPELHDATLQIPKEHDGVPFGAVHVRPAVQFPLASHVCGVRLPAPKHWPVPGTQEPVHAPLTHAWAVHPTAALHVPVAVHVCTPLPEHCVWPGAQAPWHVPATHVLLTQAAANPHTPAASQVCTPLALHRVEPGAQTPTHAPATQALSAHATAVPHVPLAAHVCTPLPEHCVVPDVHEPEHAPATHVLFVHAAAAPHAPLEVQVCTPVPEHCV